MPASAHVVTLQYARSSPGAMALGSVIFKHNMFTGNYALHMHDCYEIELITEGECTQWINGRAYASRPGSLFFLSPDDYHRFQADTPIRLLSIKLSAYDLKGDLQILLQENHGGYFLQLDDTAGNEFLRLFTDIENEMLHQTGYAAQRLQAELVLLLTGLIAKGEHVGHTSETDQVYLRYIRKAIEYIQQNYASSVTLDDVAGHCGLSKFYFTKLFAQHVGCSFSVYLTELRIHKAKKAMISSDRTITEVAFACGFGSLANFERMFKRLVGLSPHEYRKINNT